MTPEQLDAGNRAYWRDQQRKAARDWAAFDAAMAEMGKGTGAWDADCIFCEGTGHCHNNGEMDSPMWVLCDCGEGEQ